MYVLQRNGTAFKVAQEDNTVSEASRSTLLSAQNALEGRGHRRTWEAFIKTGHINDAELPIAIANSWQRCRDTGVDPTSQRCQEFIPMTAIQPQLTAYTELATHIEKKVYSFIRDKELIMVVADAHGRIIRTCGKKKMLLEADRLYFGPGALWAESSVGTNAVSLTITEKVPTQVLGGEHFCESHQVWSCSAAPIFTPFGDIWGCFDLSGPSIADHNQALWIVTAAAREIERVLFSATVANMENTSLALLKTVFRSIPMGVCVIDSNCRITYASAMTEQLLGQKARLHGRSATTFFDFNTTNVLQRVLSHVDRMPIRCLVNPNLNAYIVPLLTHESTPRYYIITLQESTSSVQVPVEAQLLPAQSVSKVSNKDAFADILFQSETMARVVEQARYMAQGGAAILLHGETGTGKELFAKAIHNASTRASGPFVAVNCGALPSELIQSELFGYKSGAFTGASKKGRPGKFELADKGTLFLDEISEMPIDMQVNLLRPLESRRVTRVGGEQSVAVDFRLITATNRNLDQLVSTGQLREDIFYRIHVLTLELPPLRQRKEDIRLIAEHHCQRLCHKYGHVFQGLSDASVQCMEAYNWPGNVRQLLHCIDFAVTMAQGQCIFPEHLPDYLSQDSTVDTASPDVNLGTKSHATATTPEFSLQKLEAQTIQAALAHHNGNMLQAAKALGIGRNTLYAKLRKIAPQE